MKTVKAAYWISTVIFALMMVFSAVPNITMEAEAVDFIRKLGYPMYFIPFIGLAKLAGSIAILIPSFRRIKEWAYAGLFFDLLAACYSIVMTTPFDPEMLFMLIFIIPGIISYIYWHKYISQSEQRIK